MNRKKNSSNRAGLLKLSGMVTQKRVKFSMATQKNIQNFNHDTNLFKNHVYRRVFYVNK
jgi:hypothetical protein